MNQQHLSADTQEQRVQPSLPMVCMYPGANWTIKWTAKFHIVWAHSIEQSVIRLVSDNSPSVNTSGQWRKIYLKWHWRLCISAMICTGLMSRKHSSDLAPIKGSSYRKPDYAPLATGHSELQPRACGTVFHPLSLQPAHSHLSKDNWKLFFSRTHFLSFSFILIVYRVLEAFSLNATLIFTLIITNEHHL